MHNYNVAVVVLALCLGARGLVGEEAGGLGKLGVTEAPLGLHCPGSLRSCATASGPALLRHEAAWMRTAKTPADECNAVVNLFLVSCGGIFDVSYSFD